MVNLFRFVGIRHLFSKPFRSSVTFLSIALGVALYASVELINGAVLFAFEESVTAMSGKSELTVSAGETGFSESVEEQARRVPGVRKIVGMIESRGFLSAKREKDGERQILTGQTLMILGVDLLKENSVRSYKNTENEVIDDPLVFLNQPDSIILAQSFANRLGVQLESQIEMGTSRGSQWFTVRGLLAEEGPAKAYGGAVAIMDIDGARHVFGKEGKVDRMDVLLKKGAKANEVEELLSQRLGAGFLVAPPEGQSQNMKKMVASFQAMLRFFGVLSLIVAVFVVANAMSISVVERKREIGTLRALGATRFGILSLFLMEALGLGVLGSFFGVFLGGRLAEGLLYSVSQGLTSQSGMIVPIQSVRMDPSIVSISIGIGIVCSVLAALWPSWKATRIDPVLAMKKMDADGSGYRSGSVLVYAPGAGVLMLIFITVSAYLGWAQNHPWVETIGQVFALVGATLVGPSSVLYLLLGYRKIRAFLEGWKIGRPSGLVTRLSQDQLLRVPLRTASNIMSLMIGLLCVVMIGVVNESFQKTIMQTFDKLMAYDLVVSGSGSMVSLQVQPIDESLGSELGKMEGVDLSGGLPAFGIRMIQGQYEGRRVGIKAYDPPFSSLRYTNLDVRDGDPTETGQALFESSEPTALISTNFQGHFGKKRGDRITVSTPSGPHEFRVVGVIADFSSSGGVIVLNRKWYRKYWSDSTVSSFALRVMPGFDPETVRLRIDQKLGRSHGLSAVLASELKKQVSELIDRSFNYTKAVQWAALCVGLLGFLNTLLISVIERFRELGMLRAVGMTQTQVFKMILYEALIQGVGGGCVAAVLGSYLAYVWITKSLSHSLGWVIDFHFPWWGVGQTLLLGIGAAVIAGCLPALRSARLQIREALQYE